MDGENCIGADVHQATIVVAVMDSARKLVTFEEGSWSDWPYDLLSPHADKLPRENLPAE